MGTAPTRERVFKLVVALDLSQYAPAVLEHALDEANRHDATEIHLVAVVESKRLRRRVEAEVAAARDQLTELAMGTLGAFGTRDGDWSVRLHVRSGYVAEEIANLAAEIEADLIVLGRFRLNRRRGRSIADEVVRTTVAPVLIVRLKDYGARESVAQCPRCVALRQDTSGNRWFCAEHLREHPLTATILMSHAEPDLGGVW
jgi:nucleotide-binding universal stress UspA family protein